MRRYYVPAGKTSPLVPQGISRHLGPVTFLDYSPTPRTKLHREARDPWIDFPPKIPVSNRSEHNECLVHASIPQHPWANLALFGNYRWMRHRVEDRSPHRTSSADREDCDRPSPLGSGCLGQPINPGSGSGDLIDPKPELAPTASATHSCPGRPTASPDRPLGLGGSSGSAAPARPSGRCSATHPWRTRRRRGR